MAECKNGHGAMVIKGTRWECPVCDYGYTIPVKMPSYTELLKENSELKEQIRKLTQNSTRAH